MADWLFDVLADMSDYLENHFYCVECGNKLEATFGNLFVFIGETKIVGDRSHELQIKERLPDWFEYSSYAISGKIEYYIMVNPKKANERKSIPGYFTSDQKLKEEVYEYVKEGSFEFFKGDRCVYSFNLCVADFYETLMGSEIGEDEFNDRWIDVDLEGGRYNVTVDAASPLDIKYTEDVFMMLKYCRTCERASKPIMCEINEIVNKEYESMILDSDSSMLKKQKSFSPDEVIMSLRMIINTELLIIELVHRKSQLEVACMENQCYRYWIHCASEESKLEKQIEMAKKSLDDLNSATQEYKHNMEEEIILAIDYENEINAKIQELPELKPMKYPTKPNEPDYEKPGLFNKKRIAQENARLKTEYEIRLNDYEKQVIVINNENDRAAQERKKLIEIIRTEVKQKLDAQAEEEKAEIKKEREEKYQTVLSDYNVAKANYSELEERLIALKNQKSSEEDSFRFPWEIELEEVNRSLQTALQVKVAFHNSGIIYEKYEQLTIYPVLLEYFEVGRCDSLTGKDGAYNLYEAESRQDVIISKLENVIDELKKINAKQSIIINSLSRMEKNLEMLNSNVEQSIQLLDSIYQTTDEHLSSIDKKANTVISLEKEVARNTELAAINTKITAYYSKKAAELTNSLGYLVALK